jgi:hypothetical protein
LEPAIGNDRVRMHRACLCHERERIPDESLADGLCVESSGGDPPRTLPDEIQGELERPFELLGAPREEKREHGIAKQPCLNEVRPSDAEIGECRLKRGAVPKGDRHSLLCGESISHRHIRRHRLGTSDSNAVPAPRAKRRIDRPAIRDFAGRGTATAHDQNGSGRNQGNSPRLQTTRQGRQMCEHRIVLNHADDRDRYARRQ